MPRYKRIADLSKRSLRRNASISNDMVETINILKEQNNTIIEMLQSMAKTNKCIKKDPNFESLVWPMKNLAEIQAFDRKLLDLAYRDQVFLILKGTRGLVDTDIRRSVKRVVEKMIAYDGLILYSWSGKSTIDSKDKTKEEFVTLSGIINLIIIMFPEEEYKTIVDEIKYIMKRVPQVYKQKNYNIISN